MRFGPILARGLALALGWAALSAPVLAEASVANRGELVSLEIRSAERSHRFRVELAETPAQQTRGLMHRTSLPRNGGMLFPFPFPRVATFWMKNTLIPLDLIFIRADGRIAGIAANARPHSLEIISSGEPVAAVLEIAGGRAARLGIRPGDNVSWSRLGPAAP